MPRTARFLLSFFKKDFVTTDLETVSLTTIAAVRGDSARFGPWL